MGAFVYILKCADHAYYVGCATGEGLERRIAQLNEAITAIYFHPTAGRADVVAIL